MNRGKPKRFQFHEGPIKTSRGAGRRHGGAGFNSMKVRLKRFCHSVHFAGVAFQFHEGPIKTVAMAAAPYPRARFNSMKVRLKRGQQIERKYQPKGFNSMKVRLKPNGGEHLRKRRPVSIP